MRRIFLSLILTSIGANLASAAPLSAALEVVSGPVYVDQGNGLVEADRFTLLNTNDKILLKAGSTALLVNENQGCIMSLREAGLYQVPSMTTCNSGQAIVLQSNINITPANGVYEPAQPVYVGQAGGAGASQSGIMFGLGFAAIAGAAAVYTNFAEEDPVSHP